MYVHTLESGGEEKGGEIRMFIPKQQWRGVIRTLPFSRRLQLLLRPLLPAGRAALKHDLRLLHGQTARHGEVRQADEV